MVDNYRANSLKVTMQKDTVLLLDEMKAHLKCKSRGELIKILHGMVIKK